MKKVLLMGLFIFVIFQIMVMATAIDIGSPAIDRTGTTTDARRTYIELNNPANATGIIQTIEIWAATNLANVEVATFYNVSGANFSTRDTQDIGAVTAGSKQTFSGLRIVVENDDYIGITYSSGQVERTGSGDGYYYTSADNIPCTDVTFTLSGSKTISLYGTGLVGITWNTKSIYKWNNATISKWNGI